MDSAKAFELLANGTLRKGCRVTLPWLTQFEGKAVEIDDAFIKRARPMELEDDWVVVVIGGKVFDTAWVGEVVDGEA